MSKIDQQWFYSADASKGSSQSNYGNNQQELRCFYSLLGIQANSNSEEINKAYRSLAKKFHPDANSNKTECTELMKLLNLAKETLTDSTKRATFDLLRMNYGYNSVNETTILYHRRKSINGAMLDDFNSTLDDKVNSSSKTTQGNSESQSKKSERNFQEGNTQKKSYDPREYGLNPEEPEPTEHQKNTWNLGAGSFGYGLGEMDYILQNGDSEDRKRVFGNHKNTISNEDIDAILSDR